MAQSFLPFFLLALTLLHNSDPISAQSSQFMSTLRTTVDELQQLLSLVSRFTGVLDGGDTRSSSAVQDCFDLLDLSVDELNWAISATSAAFSTSTGTSTSTLNTKHQHDLRSWLSAALSNQDTCSEGLSGTNIILRTLIGDGLGTVTNLISLGLSDIPGISGGGGARRLLVSEDGFPAWMGTAERRLLQAPVGGGGMQADAVVAADGSGDFTTVTAAVEAAPVESGRRIVIYVKRGVYKENIDVKKKKWNIMLVGDGMGSTVITGDRNVVDGWTTYRSATFAVSGKGFIARDITFENTAGPQKHQAVALRSDSDLSVFFRCEIKGYQDTLYAHSLRQFYRDCRITGTVDFIFGNAAAVFQSCQILARLPLPDQKNSVTAQGRKDPNQNTGFTIQYSNITADADLAVANSSTNTYLGRPWKEYSRTVVMQSNLGPAIHPQGWLEWNGNFALSTLFYAEYMNYGAGSGLASRVKWPGFHVISNASEADVYTVAQFIDGNSWLPATGVKYTAGLTM